ncbi:MAG: UDP-N-acetylmuramoyl-tripeptide--D-alanyl-D-alanine ligase [Verrucomicrobiae bacterium]|nr:UDP-N-acetylmuramoyl-tripeptide--D-alanyl-D-alanine ligase [Verrucomicrobiae bacterium]
METMTLQQIAASARGRLVAPPGLGERTTGAVCTDTRSLAPGSVFVALRGERYDAHDFLPQTPAAGVLAVVVSADRADRVPAGLARIEVDDTLLALQRIAAGYRRRLTLRTVAITGSNGKTSTKEFTAAVLAEKFNVVKTAGNLNNHVGVPLMMFSADRHHGAGVFEMGMNHPGELAPLMQVVGPEVGVVSNVGPVHIENFETESAIAQEKAVVARGIPATGTVVLNADDAWFSAVRQGVIAPVVTVGLRQKADFSAQSLRTTSSGVEFEIEHAGRRVAARISVFGRHMVANALMAVAAGSAMGVDLEAAVRGLSKAELPKMRLEPMTIRGVSVINDAYNANPVSMRAGLQTLAALEVSGRRMAVLGDMRELGAMTEAAHRQLGRDAVEAGVSALYVTGSCGHWTLEGAREAGLSAAAAHFAESAEALAKKINETAREGDAVLVKGSRGAKMEEVVAHWQQLA